MSQVQYDEPGSRTRQAWLRSALGMAAVTALVERGLALQGSSLVVALVALGPAVLFVVVSARRSVELGPHDSAGLRRAAILMTAVAVVGLSVAAAASVLGAA